MDEKIIQFEKNENILVKLAEQRVENGDYSGALSYLFSALSINRSPETLMDIADVYAQMGLYELSNRYWFYFMDRASKNKVSVAYEELAINFFYMEDFLASNYYFHKKITEDGFLSKEGLDQEIIDFFSGEEFKKNGYYIAYPFDKADYSYIAKRAKHALSIGNYSEAIAFYEDIPAQCLDEETAGDLAITYLMDDQPERSEKVARESIATHGENMTAYCNLSNVYDFKGDYEKSQYYYQKALELVKGDKNEEYKLVTCAIERNDHQNVKRFLKKILDERKYDCVMRLFYGLAQLNTGDYEGGSKTLSSLYRLDPTDNIYKFYAEYALKLTQGGSRDYLPLKYIKSLPEKLSKDYEKKLDALAVAVNKGGVSLKKEVYRRVVEWGLYCREEIARKSVYVLACEYSPYAKRTLKNYLLYMEGSPSIKQIIIYALTVNGFKEKLAVVDRNYMFKIKAKKLSFERNDDASVYVCAYALAFSRLVFFGVENIDKMADVFNEIYYKFSKILKKEDVTSDELAGLAIYLCKFDRFQTTSKITKLFEVSSKKIQSLLKLFNGDKND